MTDWGRGATDLKFELRGPRATKGWEPLVQMGVMGREVGIERKGVNLSVMKS